MSHTLATERVTWTPSSRLSRLGAGLLVAAPLLVLVGELIAPREPEGLSEAGILQFLLDHSGRLTASWVVGLLASAAIAAAYVILAQRLDGRGRIVGRLAAVLGVLGAVGLAGHFVASLATLDAALAGATPTVVAAMEDGRAALATIPPVVIGLNLAIVLISVAAARAGWAPRWIVALGALALVGDMSPTSYNTVIHAVFAAAVFGVIASALRRQE